MHAFRGAGLVFLEPSDRAWSPSNQKFWVLEKTVCTCIGAMTPFIRIYNIVHTFLLFCIMVKVVEVKTGTPRLKTPAPYRSVSLRGRYTHRHTDVEDRRTTCMCNLLLSDIARKYTFFLVLIVTDRTGTVVTTRDHQPIEHAAEL